MAKYSGPYIACFLFRIIASAFMGHSMQDHRSLDVCSGYVLPYGGIVVSSAAYSGHLQHRLGSNKPRSCRSQWQSESNDTVQVEVISYGKCNEYCNLHNNRMNPAQATVLLAGRIVKIDPNNTLYDENSGKPSRERLQS